MCDPIETLKLAIRRAFPQNPVPEAVAASSLERVDIDPEVNEFFNDFNSRRWEAIPDEAIMRNAERLSFFTAQAFCYYLPRFLFFLITCGESRLDAIELILYGLTLRESESAVSSCRVEKAKALSAAQREVALRSFEALACKDFASRVMPILRELITDWRQFTLLS